ncbi:hypothetical protein SKAU_G00238170 [Synaphobranchus kaupii]|uniref:Secreted protein n=1 Tax=Synaphobranchus kaupii TaxID=118154 RepID=A0A9Q1F7D9_SYNKA|nr:hypothetical protein SKAU_G00238170 [Synaphobranchus kaupii]
MRHQAGALMLLLMLRWSRDKGRRHGNWNAFLNSQRGRRSDLRGALYDPRSSGVVGQVRRGRHLVQAAGMPPRPVCQLGESKRSEYGSPHGAKLGTIVCHDGPGQTPEGQELVQEMYLRPRGRMSRPPSSPTGKAWQAQPKKLLQITVYARPPYQVTASLFVHDDAEVTLMRHLQKSSPKRCGYHCTHMDDARPARVCQFMIHMGERFQFRWETGRPPVPDVVTEHSEGGLSC